MCEREEMVKCKRQLKPKPNKRSLTWTYQISNNTCIYDISTSLSAFFKKKKKNPLLSPVSKVKEEKELMLFELTINPLPPLGVCFMRTLDFG